MTSVSIRLFGELIFGAGRVYAIISGFVLAMLVFKAKSSQRGRAGQSGGGAVVEWAAGLSIAEEGRRGWERAAGVLVKWGFRFSRV